LRNAADAVFGGGTAIVTSRRHRLGSDAAAKEIEIHWPSGIIQKLENVRGDRTLTVEEPVQSGKAATVGGGTARR